VIEAVSDRKIVYIGEQHDRFEHHAVQLRVIKGLYKKNPNLAIGMEMFQRPFQPVLDAYLRGELEEREFLRKSEYFRRWSFDYHLYKPILDFARAEQVPVIALNLRREITEKVSREGMDALSAGERAELPQELDLTDAGYRDRLKEVFGRHTGGPERNFDNFLQAQVLWDETMALSLDLFLKKNPGRQVVVLAGQGHIAHGSGIPKRAFRRNGYEYATILNDAGVEKDIGDYLVFPEALDGVTAPRLMVVLKEGEGRVVIADLPEDSVSRTAGLRAGDTVLMLDNAPVSSVEDLKLELFYKKPGDTVRVRVARKRFLPGLREMEFVVKLP
jgi:uncharacterized iron-regulated protein